jgi:hypothetical protein
MSATSLPKGTADAIDELKRQARLLDLAIYGATYLASHSIPAEGWEETLRPLSDSASERSIGICGICRNGLNPRPRARARHERREDGLQAAERQAGAGAQDRAMGARSARGLVSGGAQDLALRPDAGHGLG